MEEQKKTALFESLLTRNNQELRQDRGRVIVNETEKKYRRTIEDLHDRLEQLKVDRDNLLDINPGNTHTIINPSDFKADSFIEADIKIGLEIRNTEIKLEIAERRYNQLFK